jgi:hypothetical protein
MAERRPLFVQSTLYQVQFQGLPPAVTTLQQAIQIPDAVISAWNAARPSQHFYEVTPAHFDLHATVRKWSFTKFRAELVDICRATLKIT